MPKDKKVTKQEMLEMIKTFAGRNRYLPKDFYDSVKDREEEILKRVIILLYIFEQREKEIGADKMQDMIGNYYEKLAVESKKIISQEIQNGYKEVEKIATKDDEEEEKKLLSQI